MPAQLEGNSRKMTIAVPRETHKALRREAVNRDTSMQKLAEACLVECAARLAAETKAQQ